MKAQAEELEKLAPALNSAWTRLSPLMVVICALGFAVAIMARGYLGTFTRLMADDYCAAIDLARMGFLGTLKDWYLTWDGRFAANVFTLLAEGAGPGIVPVLPPLLLVVWLLALTFTIQELGRLLKWASNLATAFLIAELILYATIETAPNPIQSFQWETGLIVYSLPLVLLTTYIGIVFHMFRSAPERKFSKWLFLSAFITLIAGGFSETYVGVQTGGLALAALIVPFTVREFPRRIIFPGLIGSLCAFIIVAGAPGNAVRQSFLPFQRHLSQQLSSAFLYSFYFIYRFVREHPISFLLCIVIPAAIAFMVATPRSQEEESETAYSRIFKLLTWNVAIFLMVLSSVAPAYYGIGSRPPDRAMVTAQFVLVCAAACWGFLIGMAIARTKLLHAENYAFAAFAVGIAVLLVLGPLARARIDLASAMVFRKYAQQWDQQDQSIRDTRAKGVRNLVLRPLPVWGFGALEPPGPNPKVGFNTCIAKYYGLDSIAYRVEP